MVIEPVNGVVHAAFVKMLIVTSAGLYAIKDCKEAGVITAPLHTLVSAPDTNSGVPSPALIVTATDLRVAAVFSQ